MRHLSDYDFYIFDCDGVIFDSNQLKIEAMKTALSTLFSDNEIITGCLDYFSKNFGKSRFHHVDYFVRDLLPVPDSEIEITKEKILVNYSALCKKLYLEAEFTPGFMNFLNQLKGRKYVASGSEQQELRDIFEQRGISEYFHGIFGSPQPKSEIISAIIESENNGCCVMFGDAESDLKASLSNQIDFIFYSPYSNVQEKMLGLCASHQFPAIHDFSEVILK
ncbi:HAD family hydrolase [Vibrio quintilis]|uniref:phosphoglycolate phosphatase n=1 Tax=Vibrio quintilis TaxID=1117707 RepID=A0A1M7YUP3_9VIBR|nr:HAD family hydrolase [Vibrio quintilis]SHO56305.1 hypothetical protein VQ7734_02074 [Vibrio quintilis]